VYDSTIGGQLVTLGTASHWGVVCTVELNSPA